MSTMTTELASAGTETTKSEARRERRKQSAAPPHSVAGTLWFAGWLFTVGFTHLVWWKTVLAIIVWPYFLGQSVR